MSTISKRILVIVLLFLFLQKGTFGQRKGTEKDGVKYTLLKDNPYPFSFSGEINFFSGDLNSHNMSFFTGSKINVLVNKFSASLTYDLMYVNQLNQYTASSYSEDENTAIGESSIEVPIGAQRFEGLVGFRIFDKRDVTEVPVVIKRESGGYNSTINYFINVQARMAKPLNLEVGLRSGYMKYSFGSGEIEASQVLPNNEASTLSRKFEVDNTLSSNFQYKYFIVGASKMKLANVTVDVDGYGLRRNETASKFYGHLLLLVNSAIDDVLIEDQSVGFFQKYRLEVPMQKVGFRVGYESMNISKFGITLGTEIGLIPGPNIGGILHNGYFQFRSGISMAKIIEKI